MKINDLVRTPDNTSERVIGFYKLHGQAPHRELVAVLNDDPDTIIVMTFEHGLRHISTVTFQGQLDLQRQKLYASTEQAWEIQVHRRVPFPEHKYPEIFQRLFSETNDRPREEE